MRIKSIVLAFIAVVIWSTTFVVIKFALDDIPPMTLAFLRFLIITMILVPAVIKSDTSKKPSSLPWKELFIMGLTGVCLYMAFQNIGLVYTTASEASVITSLIPVVTVVIAWLSLKERLDGVQVLGVLLSVSGVVLTVSGAQGGIGAPGRLLGNALMFLTTIAWALYTATARSVAGKFDATAIAAYSDAIGAAMLLPFCILEMLTVRTPRLTLPGIASLLYLSLGGSGVAYLFWNKALIHLKAGEAATMVNLSRLVGILTAVWFLNETITPIQIMGIAVGIVGVSITTFRQQHRVADGVAE